MNLIKKIKKYGILRSICLIIPTIKSRQYPNKRKQKFRQHGESTLKHLVKILSKNHITYWVEYGTLLGIIRDNKLIEWDLDLDFGVFPPEDKDYYKKILESEGCTRLKVWFIDNQVIEETYIYKGVHFDLYYFRSDEDKLFTYTCYKDPQDNSVTLDKYRFNLIKYSYSGYTSFINYNYNGVYVVIPENYDLALTQKYGDWRVKNPSWTIFDSPVAEKLTQHATLVREPHCKTYQ